MDAPTQRSENPTVNDTVTEAVLVIADGVANKQDSRVGTTILG